MEVARRLRGMRLLALIAVLAVALGTGLRSARAGDAWDSDDDGLPDALEVDFGTDPNDADTDDDRLTDGQEVGYLVGGESIDTSDDWHEAVARFLATPGALVMERLGNSHWEETLWSGNLDFEFDALLISPEPIPGFGIGWITYRRPGEEPQRLRPYYGLTVHVRSTWYGLEEVSVSAGRGEPMQITDEPGYGIDTIRCGIYGEWEAPGWVDGPPQDVFSSLSAMEPVVLPEPPPAPSSDSYHAQGGRMTREQQEYYQSYPENWIAEQLSRFDASRRFTPWKPIFGASIVQGSLGTSFAAGYDYRQYPATSRASQLWGCWAVRYEKELEIPTEFSDMLLWGHADVFERQIRTNPRDADTDGDGLIDSYEGPLHFDPTRADTDGDGIGDLAELAARNGDQDEDGLLDIDEILLGTLPFEADVDGDLLPDPRELEAGTDPFDPDTDHDGLSDAREVLGNWDPLDPDMDGDGLLDGEEVLRFPATSPHNRDTDRDGLDDGEEIRRGTDPTRSDSDLDGWSDGLEVQQGTDPMQRDDSDGDGIGNGYEQQLGTNPYDADTDRDGLGDLQEIQRGTDPLLQDSDDDGALDGQEVQGGTDPLRDDTDGDGLPDGDELARGTDPLATDTDGDKLWDGAEVILGTSPLDVDSDRDGLQDSDELSRFDVQGQPVPTDPLDPDTDDDGLLDGQDPDPLVAGISEIALASAAMDAAGAIAALPDAVFVEPSRAADRRAWLTDRMQRAAQALRAGDLDSATSNVLDVRDKMDGAPSPTDTVQAAAAQAQAVLADLDALLAAVRSMR